MINNFISVPNLLDALAILLSVNIIFWFSGAIYFSIKTIKLYKEKEQVIFFGTIFDLVVAFLFAGLFWYIIIATATKGSLIDNGSFGALYIRPLILLEAVGTAIAKKDKYRRERRRLY